jgi:putative endonuclease
MFYTYIMASRRNGTLYTGMTDDLPLRVRQHKAKYFDGFTAKYGVDKLVWFESHKAREHAILRERRIKAWRRLWKLHLIEARNQHWVDLTDDLEGLLAEEQELGLYTVLPGSRPTSG